jgi:hypothetical protein
MRRFTTRTGAQDSRSASQFSVTRRGRAWASCETPELTPLWEIANTSLAERLNKYATAK